jgi:acyl-coenzyme A thioesterase PaaI-like protein
MLQELLADWRTKFGPHPDGEALPPHHDRCLGCGPANPHGHHLNVIKDGDSVTATHVFDERHVGAPGIAHGGAVATVFDDLCGFLLYLTGAPAVTRKLQIDYHAPVLLGTLYHLCASVARSEGRKLFVDATMRDSAGAVVAAANGFFLVVDVSHFTGALSLDVPG